jgi:uncharacterized protein involved in outer membrane biogenesis
MPNGLKRALIGVLTALMICYCLLGFLILPGVAQRVVNQQLVNYATVPAHLQRIEFNPFSLELRLFNLHIGEQEQAQIGFDRLYIDMEWSSLWHRALQIADIELVRLQSEVVFDKNGTLNLSQLFDIPPSEEEVTEDKELFALEIGRLRLVEGSLHFADARPNEPVDFLLDSLNFELRNFATRPDSAADASLIATGPSGARIDWTGEVNLAPISSSGHLEASNMLLKDFWSYARDSVPLKLRQGRLSVVTDYRLDLSEGTELTLNQLGAKLASLELDSPQDDPLIRLEELEISESSMDLAKRQVVIGNLRSGQLQAWAGRDANGEINWQKLLAPTSDGDDRAAENPPQAAPTPATSSDVPGTGKPASEAWQVLLKDAQLRDYRVHLTDQVPPEVVNLELGPLDLDLTDFDSRGDSLFALKLSTGVGDKGSLQAEGQLQLSPASGQLSIDTRDIDLRIAQAYLSPFVHLELRSGFLATGLDLTLTGTDPLAFEINGAVDVTQLHTLDTINNRDFLKWQRLQLDNLSYQHPKKLDIGNIELTEPYARFIINPDLTTNINDLLVGKTPAPTADSQTNGTQSDEQLAIHIGGVSIDDGSANFSDLSLRPPFITAVQELNGEVGTLDNQAQQPASVDVTGKVDRYAPVTIKGSLTPFDPLQSLDIATSFRQVELTTLSPYSSKFAGYRIRKGRLDLDLHYRINQGQLNAENRVVLQQLQLGEQVDSPQAVDLPIRLAVALLKDSKGTISLELPVQGNLNNPEFDVMPIVWKTLRNLVTRAAKAPFKFLGSLVGGREADLDKVLFPAGSSELTTQVRNNLDTLGQALNERPVLRLEVEGRSSPDADGPLLAEQWLEREYQQTSYNMLQRSGEKVPSDPADLSVSEDSKPSLLEGIYRSRLKQQPPEQWNELDEQARSERMRDAVLSSRADSPALLRRLSRERASAIKDYLVDQVGLADARVYLLDTGISEAGENGLVPTTLHLGSE